MDIPEDDPTAARALAVAGELRVLVGQLRRRLKAHTQTGGLTPSQLSALGHIARDCPATVTTLARAEGVRPQSMGATIAALEAAGLVAGTPDPADGRQTLLSLTPACLDWVQASRAAREDWLAGAIRTRLAPDEQEQLAAAVALLKRLVDS
ncbi:MAG: MarR family transcriptional regulator [Pseudomonadota bacterium]